MKNTLHLGLDVHKELITIATAAAGHRHGEVRVYGTITNDLHALEKALAAIRKAHPGARLEACYEAGPCGFGIARRLAQWKIPCRVVAPSLIPTRSGDRIKTDKRDALKLARLLRAGELPAIYIPEPTDEAIRDLCRARTDAVDDLRRSRHRLKAFLLRHGYRYQGRSPWTQAHLRYLRELVVPHPAMKVILEEYLMAISAASERIARSEEAMRTLLEGWRLKPAVEALMAFKGFQLVAAMITVSEPRRHPPVCTSPATDDLPWTGPERAHERQEAAPGLHHQDGEPAPALVVDRVRATHDQSAEGESGTFAPAGRAAA
jgi:transposase